MLKNANHEFGNSIVAALQLGSIDLLTANINWLRGLLVSYHFKMPEKAMVTYTEAYYAAITQYLRGDGATILIEWFERLRKNNAVAQRMRDN